MWSSTSSTVSYIFRRGKQTLRTPSSTTSSSCPTTTSPTSPQQVAGAFLGRFSNWTATLLWGSKAEMGAPLQNSAQRQFQIGAQLVVGKATEVVRAHVLIGNRSCVSAANLSLQQQMQ